MEKVSYQGSSGLPLLALPRPTWPGHCGNRATQGLVYSEDAGDQRLTGCTAGPLPDPAAPASYLTPTPRAVSWHRQAQACWAAACVRVPQNRDAPLQPRCIWEGQSALIVALQFPLDGWCGSPGPCPEPSRGLKMKGLLPENGSRCQVRVGPCRPPPQPGPEQGVGAAGALGTSSGGSGVARC